MPRREPVVAGAFYPGERNTLDREIDRHLSGVEDVELPGTLLGVIVPHAGYMYSGPVAAWSYRQLQKARPDVVVVLALSHRFHFDGASVMPDGEYATPFGDASVDEVLATKILEQEGFDYHREADAGEHSLEVQVPFIQKVAPGASIIPITVGTQNPETCRMLGEGLSRMISADSRSISLVISTDLSHFHSYDRARELDSEFIDAVTSMDVNRVAGVLSRGKAEACGAGPVMTGMVTAAELGAKGVKVLKYANSGDTAGMRDSVVGYFSAALHG
jgi:hypothetical protein